MNMHYASIPYASICSIASVLPIGGPIIEILLPRLLPTEPGILPGPQGRIILIDALDVVTSPSWYLGGD